MWDNWIVLLISIIRLTKKKTLWRWWHSAENKTKNVPDKAKMSYRRRRKQTINKTKKKKQSLEGGLALATAHRSCTRLSKLCIRHCNPVCWLERRSRKRIDFWFHSVAFTISIGHIGTLEKCIRTINLIGDDASALVNKMLPLLEPPIIVKLRAKSPSFSRTISRMFHVTAFVCVQSLAVCGNMLHVATLVTAAGFTAKRPFF